MIIQVQTIRDEMIRLDIDRRTTLQMLHVPVHLRMRIRPSEQCFIFQGKVLEDKRRALVEYDIHEHDTIFVVRASRIPLIISNLHGVMLVVEVNPFGSVLMLKKEIASQTNIHEDKQRLVYGGRELANETRLLDHGIGRDSKIYCVQEDAVEGSVPPE